MFRKKVTFIFLFCFGLSFGQNEASYWYFGNRAGLKFNNSTGTVTAITDGQLSTLEGCTSISDQNGDLLFYSDGRFVWNKNHQIMPNGTGLNGNNSSTSSGVIIPKPQDPGIFYLFTVDEPHHDPSARGGGNFGLNYSQINITANGGLGEVDPTFKNVPLVTYDIGNALQAEYKCSEKITAVRADDCSSLWVITHFVDSFYAFKVDTDGVMSTPVISTVGTTVPVQGYRRNALGYIKASPDGNKIAVAHFGFATALGTNAPGGVFLYDFDNDTGIVSNENIVYSPANGNSPYGVEFSSSNKKLYATIGTGASGNSSSQVIQWDLEAANISASQQTIHTSNTLSGGALQLGIDGRIYRAQTDFDNFPNTGQFLGVIENPEADGLLANYNENGILVDINGNFQNTSRIGLPPFIQSLFNSTIDIINDQTGTTTSTQLILCDGDSYMLRGEDIQGADYFWSRDGVPLSNNNFELIVNSPGFYELIIEPNNGECPILGEATVSYSTIPVAHPIASITACNSSSNGLEPIDFTVFDNEILLSQDPNQFTVNYFQSFDDALNNNNPLTNTFDVSIGLNTFFARIENNDNPNCFDTTSFNVDVYRTPTIENLPNIESCDALGDFFDGIAETDFQALIPNIIGNQTDVSVSFHSSLSNAEANTGAFPNLYINTTPFLEVIFVRIENNANPTECYSTDSFEVSVNPAPIANNTTLIQCDEDSFAQDITVFNLSEISAEVSNNEANRSVDYYLTLTDAENQVNPLDSNAYENISNPQLIYARVTNTDSGCFNFAEITLDISTTTTNDAVLTLCDDDGTEDGFQSFNLADANPIVLAGAPVTLTAAYYETYLDALLESNPLGNTFTNTTPYNQTIYARVENTNNCFGISEVELIVHPMPQVVLQEEVFLCLNASEALTLTAGLVDDIPNNYAFEWSTGATTTEIMVNTPGTYTVRVFNAEGCFKERTITVTPSNIATIDNIEVIDPIDNNTIIVMVSGEGIYEYALNNPNGPYQSSNTFTNVRAGIYTVYVRDIKNNCGIVDQVVSVIGFPKFFSPNGDSYNPTWQVKGISNDIQPNTNINIFDRMGRLIKVLNPTGPGWDGTVNGVLMPATDYWFEVILQDGRTFNGHFALIR